jgi:hypothetical protein
MVGEAEEAEEAEIDKVQEIIKKNSKEKRVRSEKRNDFILRRLLCSGIIERYKEYRTKDNVVRRMNMD